MPNVDLREVAMFRSFSSPSGRRAQGLALAAAVVASLAGVGGAVARPSSAPVAAAHPGAAVARNVIVIQGDGMGVAHREFIRLATKGHDGELAMDSLRYSGWVHTDPADPAQAVTDSAAAATAYASGVTTYNGAVGVDVDRRPVPTLLEQARRMGKAAGLVTTAQVTDASPAAFGAHVPDRSDQSEIARQFLVGSRPDVILGGGEDWWLPPGTPGAYPDEGEDGSRGTAGNLIRRAQALGYDYVSTRAELRASSSRRLLGLFANEEMFTAANEGPEAAYDPVVPLPEMAAKALSVLSRDRDGFFLFLEEEGIDEMAHANNAHLVLAAGQALDRTVAVAKAFAARHPGTLILVEGDHETGGLAIENVDPADESGDGTAASPSAEDGPFAIPGTDLRFTVDWTTGQHTGAATPLTADGPGAARLGRVQQNTAVHDAILAAMRGR
jgi:alkaline phosphatase